RNADGVARIPLMIRMPGTKPSIYKEDFQLIDLLPTILDVLGLPYEKAKLDGVSCFSSERPARDKIVSFLSFSDGIQLFEISLVFNQKSFKGV
ncbi:hypothetical protein L0152_20295, partial [bacterium]|nr:hypothetical protein [bacterium]